MTLVKNGGRGAGMVRKVMVGICGEVGIRDEKLDQSIKMGIGATELVVFNKEKRVKAGESPGEVNCEL